jgi:hypothetical protein
LTLPFGPVAPSETAGLLPNISISNQTSMKILVVALLCLLTPAVFAQSDAKQVGDVLSEPILSPEVSLFQSVHFEPGSKPLHLAQPSSGRRNQETS